MARGTSPDTILYGDFPRASIVTADGLSANLWEFPTSPRRPLSDYGNVAFAWMNSLNDMYGREASLKRGEGDNIQRLAEGYVDNNLMVIVNRVILNSDSDPELDWLIWSAEKGDPQISQARVTRYPEALDRGCLDIYCSLGEIRVAPDNQATLDGKPIESFFS